MAACDAATYGDMKGDTHRSFTLIKQGIHSKTLSLSINTVAREVSAAALNVSLFDSVTGKCMYRFDNFCPEFNVQK